MLPDRVVQAEPRDGVPVLIVGAVRAGMQRFGVPGRDRSGIRSSVQGYVAGAFLHPPVLQFMARFHGQRQSDCGRRRELNCPLALIAKDDRVLHRSGAGPGEPRRN